MNVRRLIGIIAVALVFGSVAPTAVAGQPDDVTITVHADFMSGSAFWSSTGAVVDHGTLVAVGQRLGPHVPQWTAHEDLRFTGQAGTFTLQQQARGVDLSPILSVGTSRWVVRSGSGAYADLGGEGTGELVFHWDAMTLDATLTGRMRVLGS